MLAARITLPHFSISSAISFPSRRAWRSAATGDPARLERVPIGSNRDALRIPGFAR